MLAPWLPPAARQYATQLGSHLLVLLMILLWQVEPVADGLFQAVTYLAALLHVPLDLAFEGMGQYLWWQT
jgi:hypothetical protein